MLLQRLFPLALLLSGTALNAQAYDDRRAAPGYDERYDQAYGDERYDDEGDYDDDDRDFATQPGDLFGGQNVRDTREFIRPLEQYGDWVQSRFGLAFRPNVEQGWRPYTRGRWAEDRLWISDDPWGWATDHYGRWGFDQRLGWVWVPGREWAPSWVAWREDDQISGWAPIPPGIAYSYNSGFGGNFGYDNYNSWYAPSWVWVPRAYVYQPRFGNRILRSGAGINYWRGTRFNYRSNWNGRPGYARPNFVRPSFGRPGLDRRGYPRADVVRPNYDRRDDLRDARRDAVRDGRRADRRLERRDDRRDDRRQYEGQRGGAVGNAIGGGIANVPVPQRPRGGFGGRPGGDQFQGGPALGSAIPGTQFQRPAREGRSLREDIRDARRQDRRDAIASNAIGGAVQPRPDRATPPAMAVNPQSIPTPRNSERAEQRAERRAERAAARADRPDGGQRRRSGDGLDQRPQ